MARRKRSHVGVAQHWDSLSAYYADLWDRRLLLLSVAVGSGLVGLGIGWVWALTANGCWAGW